MKSIPALSILLTLVLCLLASPAQAGDGHDHGDAAPSATGPALPRFAATSDAFELVGVLSGKQLTLYLDRSADNSPVPGAQIELDLGGAKYKAAAQGDAVYELMLPAVPKAGVLPITATVTAGNETDLLAGELDLHDAAHADAAAHAPGWRSLARWPAAGLATLAALALLAWAARRMSAHRALRAGGVA